MKLKERLEILQGKEDIDKVSKKDKTKKRAYQLTKEQLDFLDEIVDMSIDYVYLLEMNEYQKFFKKHLAAHGVKSPFQIKDPEERKEFFNSLKAGWAAEKAKNS